MTETRTFDLVDEALRTWRQGDCYLGDCWFLFRSDIERPLTPESVEAAAEGIDSVEVEAAGFMVVTQTCDIVRSCHERPFIEVSPLVEVDAEILRSVGRGQRPSFAFVEGAATHNLVADLDRVMTVEKSVVAKWSRTPGCSTDSQARGLATALARKCSRTAFPDDFVALAAGLVQRAKSKHAKNSPEGRALQSLREIRVRAAPSWDATDVQLTFLFILEDPASAASSLDASPFLKTWLARLSPSGRFTSINGFQLSLDDLTARDYVDSDPLDLEHLSARAGPRVLGKE